MNVKTFIILASIPLSAQSFNIAGLFRAPASVASSKDSSSRLKAIALEPVREPLAKEGYWQAYLDNETTGLVYYFNIVTGERSWVPPSKTFPEIQLESWVQERTESLRKMHEKQSEPANAIKHMYSQVMEKIISGTKRKEPAKTMNEFSAGEAVDVKNLEAMAAEEDDFSSVQYDDVDDKILAKFEAASSPIHFQMPKPESLRKIYNKSKPVNAIKHMYSQVMDKIDSGTKGKELAKTTNEFAAGEAAEVNKFEAMAAEEDDFSSATFDHMYSQFKGNAASGTKGKELVKTTSKFAAGEAAEVENFEAALAEEDDFSSATFDHMYSQFKRNAASGTKGKELAKTMNEFAAGEAAEVANFEVASDEVDDFSSVKYDDVDAKILAKFEAASSPSPFQMSKLAFLDSSKLKTSFAHHKKAFNKDMTLADYISPSMTNESDKWNSRVETTKTAFAGVVAGRLALEPFASILHLFQPHRSGMINFETVLGSMEAGIFALAYNYCVTEGDESDKTLSNGLVGVFAMARTWVQVSAGAEKDWLHMFEHLIFGGVESVALFGATAIAMDFFGKSGLIARKK